MALFNMITSGGGGSKEVLEATVKHPSGVANLYQITFTNLEGKPDWFVCVLNSQTTSFKDRIYYADSIFAWYAREDGSVIRATYDSISVTKTETSLTITSSSGWATGKYTLYYTI